MDTIHIENAYLNNLKNISLNIPKKKIVAITGISGSGKSSLAFDLIFEEGRKRYLQSIGMGLDFGTPAYTSISGLSPTVAVKQNLIRQSNPRSTLGSKTGLLNQLGLLFAHEASDEEVLPDLFSYLSPSGMCFDCQGTGRRFHLHMDKIVTSKTMSVKELFTSIGSTPGFLNLLKRNYPEAFDVPFTDLDTKTQDILTYGTLDPNTGKTSYCIERILQNRMARGESVEDLYTQAICETCHGYRVCEEALEIRLNNKHIGELASLPLIQLRDFLIHVKGSSFSDEMIQTLLKSLDALINIRLGHLTLYREMPSLSGGELQRVFLHDHLESNLDSLIYVFDEPTSGLHPSEKHIIMDALIRLKNQGNTVLVVTHDKTIIHQADHIIDMGRGAGVEGGTLVYQGNIHDFKNSQDSLTASYLRKDISKNIQSRTSKRAIVIDNANQNNLKNLSVSLPLGQCVGIAGVSGSGKSTLISKTLVPLIKTQLKTSNQIHNIRGVEHINDIVEISQAPIGRKSNSNPVTYIGLWDKIRSLYAQESLKQNTPLTPGDFSFNSKGACSLCRGSGLETITLGYDLKFEKTCPECHGTRFNDETLAIKYQGQSVSDVLDMSVSEALVFFKTSKLDLSVLKILESIGMGYIQLGQATSTLSGGESQRIKLAKEMGKKRNTKTLYVLDEPSTGLSQYDIAKLLTLLDSLLERGSSILLIEHDIDVLKACDWIIEMGPEGGEKGGYILSEGTPQSLKDNPKSLTGAYL